MTILLLCLCAVAGCGGSSSSTTVPSGDAGLGAADADRGGSANDAASTETSSGVPDDTSNCPGLPSCLGSLIGPCAPDGACQASGLRRCYANGVKSQSSLPPPPALNSITVFNADGTVCYSKDTLGGSSLMETYKDASGATVATVVVDSNGGRAITCAAGGPTVMTTTACVAAAENGSAAPCVDGTCM
jgi:hypothetical protein